MSKVTSILLAFVAILVLVGAVCFTSYVSAYNYGNEAEKELTATLNNNKNILAQYSNKVAEAAQVPEMYRDDLAKVVQAAMEGRYGNDGSKATWQWIQEQNPTVDVAVYAKLQVIIEAGRNEFRDAQTVLLDKKRAYETNLGYLWKGFWLRIAGYPSINLDDIKIVTNDRTEGAYEQGKEEPITLRK